MMLGSVDVYEVACPGDGARWPQELASRRFNEVCLVRSGCFRYRDRRGTVLVDPTTALLAGPDDGEYDVVHPHRGGDLDTFLRFDADLLASVGGGTVDLPAAAHLSPALELAHRRLVGMHGSGCDPDGEEELTVGIVADLLASGEPLRVAAGAPRTRQERRRLVDDARALLVADPDLPLLEIAATLGCGPHHLSRSFRRLTGQGVAAFKLSVRVHQALEGLAQDVSSLADLANASGFYDHSHLARTFRARFGTTPSAVRAELNGLRCSRQRSAS